MSRPSRSSRRARAGADDDELAVRLVVLDEDDERWSRSEGVKGVLQSSRTP